MISDAIINYVGFILRTLIGLLPTYTGMPIAMGSAIDFMFQKIAGIADFFPMSTVWTIFLSWLSIEIAVLGFRFVAWLFHWKTNPAGTPQ